LEASFFGVLLFGRSRVPPWFYLFSTAMVALGTTLSAFWIMVNNSWMQVPVGYVVENGVFVPDDWTRIIFNSVVWVRFPHMLLGAYLTGAFCVAATGAWYLLRKIYHAEAKVMLAMGLGLAAVLVPVQLLFGHLTGRYVGKYQPSKMAAIEARWNDEKPASEVLIAWPDVENRRNLYAITLPPPFGSLIDSDSLSAGEVGLNSIPRRPGRRSSFYSSRFGSWSGVGFYLSLKDRIDRNRWLLWPVFLASPCPSLPSSPAGTRRRWVVSPGWSMASCEQPTQ
jgi:cytochrome bd ubiquinol oxidase subunit I